MRDASWNTFTPDAPSRFPGWMKALAVMAVLAAVLITVLASYQQAARRQAWPLARAVTARLATDEGTLDLYRKNPALQEAYPTEQAFLGTVRSLRAGLALPEQEPTRESRSFQTQTGPARLRIRLRGEGGTWMDLVVARRSAFGPVPQGEGIVSLRLAGTREGLRAQLDREREAGSERQWRRFLEEAAPLATEDGARTLLARPGLTAGPADPSAFLALRRTRQAGLAALPATFAGAHARLSIHGSPFGREVRMTCPLAGGGSLGLTWKNDQLTAVDLD
ncbi:hypothetical protein GETHPA_04440 [Geothrix rubra]|uniref:Uncharacterized protein n=1 Tax=Geothrix rubra TaxID=2927977 RepID=A0ABQ5Q397_9BACT|nr:hypothetical protein [Geothrix rubra]GLH68911.1 hypothetical protein GETHPA_04440 [Geothrix rubra]